MIEEREGRFCIISHDTGKNLGCYDTKEEAETRLAEIMDYASESRSFLFSKKTIQMPILPSKPGKTVDGRDVPQELINAILGYDADRRTAIVKLDRQEAHGKHDAEQNTAVLGRVARTYEKDGIIYADVQPQKGFEHLLPTLAGVDGAFPDRSIEADYLELTPGEKTLWLEAVALCGTQRPALSLPSISYTNNTANSNVKYTLSLTGGGQQIMPDEKPQDEIPQAPPATPPAATEEQEQKLMYGTAEPISKAFAKYKADTAAREKAYLEEIEKLRERDLDRELDHWSKSPKMLRKLPQFARANAVNLIRAAMTGQGTATFHFAKGPETVDVGAGIQALLESLPDTLISTGQVAAYIDTTEFDDVPVTSQEKQALLFSKMRSHAKTNNLDLNDRKVFEKVEREILAENPELREGSN